MDFAASKQKLIHFGEGSWWQDVDHGAPEA
jgi:hypothetical protein